MSPRPSQHRPPLRRLGAVFLLALLCSPCAALAHHSFAMYDPTRLVTLKGVVKDFEWTNPHALVWIIVGPDDKGQTELWSVELPTSPGNLTRLGWTKRSLNPGDKVAIDINPLRDGRHGGSLKKAVTASGQVLTVNLAPTPADAPATAKP